MIRRLLAALLLCCTLAAEEPAIEVGFGNTYRVGPVPVRVPLSNDGPDEEGDLVVEVSDFLGVTRYVVPLLLPRGARKSVVVHVSMSNLAVPIEVWWCPTGKPRREIPVPSITASAIKPGDRLVLCVCGDPVMAQAMLPGLMGRSTGGGIAYCRCVEPALVPDVAHALSSVDLVYLRKIGERDLTEGQVEALETWVWAGGHLLLTGETAQAQVIERFLPGSVRGRRTLDHFDVFSKLYGTAKATPSEVAVLLPDAEAEVLCKEGEVPLIATARRGAGRVTLVAFDPFVEPFLTSPGLGVMWDAILLRGERRDPPYDDAPVQKSVVEVLSTRQGPTLATVIVGGIVIALFLIGLRWASRRAGARPDRLAFAVFSTPALAVALAILAWALGFATRGGDRLDSVVFVEAAPGARRGVAVSYDAFYHHTAGRYHEEPLSRHSLCLTEVSAIFDLRRRVRYTWREGSSPRLAEAEFFQSSSRIFRTIGELDVGEGIHGDLVLSPEGASGSLTNGTPWDLEEVWLLTARQRAMLGAVPRGGVMRAPTAFEATSIDPVGVTEMARGGRLREGIANRLAVSWDWTQPSASGGSKAREDLLLVAFVKGGSVWRPSPGREGTCETVLVVPLPGRDASGGEGGK